MMKGLKEAPSIVIDKIVSFLNDLSEYYNANSNSISAKVNYFIMKKDLKF